MGKISYRVRPETAVLTRGFDPHLSVGSARPPVYRSSTYVFSSPEAAERAFGIVLGRVQPLPEESPELIYARLNHPNAEILEDQLVPLERGAAAAAVFNSGMAASFTVLLGVLERDSALIYTQPLADAITHTKDLKLVLIETPPNPTLRMTDIAAAAPAVRLRPTRPLL